ncbi:MAG: hypothetical protein P8L65_00850 [Flavobacteriaceae bacterium]|nr:hypothetical protein [Flavobacteriaceae bacterium]
MKKTLLLLLFPMIVISQPTIQKIERLIEQQKLSEAEILAVDYNNHNPLDLSTIELLGDVYGHQKKWDEAIIQYKKLVDTEKLNANYQFKYGGVLGMKALTVNKFKALPIINQAKTAFLTAANLDSTHIEVRWALVKLYMQLPGIVGGSKRKSVIYAQELESLSKVDGLLAKAYINEYDKKPLVAEFYYQKAVEVGGSPHCYDKLISFYLSLDEFNKAILTIEDAYRKHRQNNLMYQLGELSSIHKIELNKGELSIKKFIDNYSKEDVVSVEWAYLRLAQIQKYNNNIPDAIENVNRALLICPDFKEAKKERALILSL